MNPELFLILHDIRSTHNVGSMFRTADAVGISKIYITGYTPAPLDRFGRPRKDIAKVSLGAEKTMPWEYVEKIDTLISKLKKEKISLVALEQDPKSINAADFKVKKPTALIVGNEVGGVSASILKKCDVIIELPMKGKKESLNVAVATGVALYLIQP